MIIDKEKSLGTIQLSKNKIHHTEMMNILKKQLDEVPHNGKDTFLNTPVLIDAAYVSSTSYLCTLLNTAFQKIVKNYFNDIRIRNIYNLDAALEDLLKEVSETPYNIGFYRPDFIYNTEGFPKICEIGCRYPVNGWMLSFYLNDVIQKLHPQSKNVINKKAFLSAITTDLNKEEPIYLVHDKEHGTEIFYLLKELNSLGYKSYAIHPKEIQLKNGELEVHGKPSCQFILEMDREELKEFDAKILKKITEKAVCINDLRTLILIHDKRVLAVMYDEEIMLDYISNEEYSYLKKFLIPSFTLDSLEKRTRFISSNQNWVLKNNSGGRGIGMYIKNDCDLKIWKHTITKKWKKYMVQEFVEQKKFPLEASLKAPQQIHIVGMLLCHNHTSFGPGLFRGSSENIINLHQGRGVVLPCIIIKPY
ncbi:MAG: hypothetical protein JKY44_05920 [Flavobacteriaceae bacterium]|nr:hypothetical protein [Flavobacteriaceae bacterium]